MLFKFEKLEVWQLALGYVELIYDAANQLPTSEECERTKLSTPLFVVADGVRNAALSARSYLVSCPSSMLRKGNLDERHF